MSDKEFVVDQDVADKMYEVVYDESATPAQLWDAISAARGPAIDTGVKACNDGSYLGPCGVTHFGTGLVGHLFFSTILDRVQAILEDPTYDPGSKIAYALDFINESWEVANARLAGLTAERETRIGRY